MAVTKTNYILGALQNLKVGDCAILGPYPTNGHSYLSTTIRRMKEAGALPMNVRIESCVAVTLSDPHELVAKVFKVTRIG